MSDEPKLEKVNTLKEKFEKRETINQKPNNLSKKLAEEKVNIFTKGKLYITFRSKKTKSEIF
jgi:hypothetical protein